MYCTNCGTKINKNNAFCKQCGKRVLRDNDQDDLGQHYPKIPLKIPPLNKPEKNKDFSINEGDKEKLKKAFKNAGDSSLAIGILNIFLIPLAYYSLESMAVKDTILYSLIDYIFIFPYIYFGIKIKKDDLNNLFRSLKINRNMLIYSAAYLVFLLSMGGRVGILFLFVMYYLYKSYKSTKEIISKSKK